MKHFLVRLFMFVLLLTGVLSVLAAFTDVRLRGLKKGKMRSWYLSAHGLINADVLILGSSHAHVQVDPRRLAAAFPGKTIFNLGLEGYALDMQLARYRFYRRYNRRPDVIVLCADYTEFGKSRWEVDRTQFLPYLYDTALRRTAQQIGASKLATGIPFLKYFGEADALSAGILGKSPLHDDAIERRGWSGFEPVDLHWKDPPDPDTVRVRSSRLPDSGVWQSFRSFLAECSAQNVTVYVVFTPHHEQFSRRLLNSAAYRRWLQTALPEQVSFIDFSDAALCRDTAFFYNGTHLNAKGADVFSALLADSIRQRNISVKP